MSILSKIWPGLSIALIILLAFLLIRGCKMTPPVDNGASIRAAYDSAKRVDSPVIARLSREKDSLGNKIDTLTAALLDADQDLQARAGDLSGTMTALDQARERKDTVARLAHGDTLEAEVKAGIPAVKGYVRLTDSLINAGVAQRQVSDSIIVKLNSLNHVGETTITQQQLQYDILHKDFQHNTAQLKFYKPVAIGGAAAVAIIIVLKFIAH